ncbi:MAG: hypothetical protein GYB31_04580 [Bacteroidetes bacterium]|nr:hypothetical protein [Bacteroidota bacterium]
MRSLNRLHFFSGIFLCVFISLHLFNHLLVFFDPETHIRFMEILRVVYRNIVVEVLLIGAVYLQIYSGLKLLKNKWRLRKRKRIIFYQLITGFYLSFFLVIHTSAIFAGRLIFDLDTNLYFGAAGINRFPLNLFFIPYYFLATIAVFWHLACAVQLKAGSKIGARILFVSGVFLAIVLIYGLSSGFAGLEIPSEYYVPYGLN